MQQSVSGAEIYQTLYKAIAEVMFQVSVWTIGCCKHIISSNTILERMKEL